METIVKNIARRSFFLTFGLVAALGLGGCAGRQVETSQRALYRDCPRPSWAEQPMCEGGLCAVGIGKSMDYGFARTKAEADARDKLAHTLESDVRGLLEKYVEENRELTVNGGSSGFEFSNQVSQQLASIVLRGSRVQAYYDDCVRDSVYTLMVLEPEALVAQLQDAMAKAAEKTHLFNKAQAREAIDRMNRLIEDRYGDTGSAVAGGGRE